MPALDVLVLGDVNPDIVVGADDPHPQFAQGEKLVDSIELTIGGSASIFACAAANLGLRVALVGVVGDDAFGALTRSRLQDRGVDVSGVRVHPDLPTGASVILSGRDDRAIMTMLGTIPTLRVQDVSETLLAAARHVHVASYFLLHELRPDLPDLFRGVRRAGGTTS